VIAAEVVGEGVGQAHRRGQVRTGQARAEDPDLRDGVQHRARRDDPIAIQRPVIVVALAPAGPEVAVELLDVADELVLGAGGRSPAAQDRRRPLIAARRTAQPKIDPAGVQRLEDRELLGHGQRRVVGQHHPAGAEPDPLGLGAQMGQQNRRRGRGHRRHVVVLGYP
jgi:hypothetical protein